MPSIDFWRETLNEAIYHQINNGSRIRTAFLILTYASEMLAYIDHALKAQPVGS